MLIPPRILFVSVLGLAVSSTGAAGQTLVHSHVQRVERDSIMVTFFADGSIKNAVGKAEGFSNANGALGLAMATSAHDITALMNVASGDESVREGFGSSLLAPVVGSGRGINAALFDIRVFDAPTRLFGTGGGSSLRSYVSRADLHMYGSLSSARWQIPDSLVPPTAVGSADSAISTAIVGLGALLYHDFLHQRVAGSNDLSLGMEIGVAYRQLFGDIATKQHDPLKSALLHSDQEVFWGLETGIYLQVNRVKAGATYYFLRSEDDIPGLSDGQVVVAISIQGEMFSAKAFRDRSRRGTRGDVSRPALQAGPS
ncbi:MAG TPA: hypothetical protein VHG51_14395 [Longimicrobiaceae bacterium]|nr:hypothetical protein [Longimicrobiaceae bacterium]